MASCVVDIARDQSDTFAVCMAHDGDQASVHLFDNVDDVRRLISDEHDRYVCFDSRPLLDYDIPSEKIFDIQLALDEKSFSRVASNMMSAQSRDYLELEQSLKAHRRTAKSSGIDLTRNSLFRMMPKLQLDHLFASRVSLMREIAGDHSGTEQPAMRFMPALRRIERAGVFVCAQLSGELISSGGMEPFEERFHRSIVQTSDSFMYTRYCPVGVKTNRFRIDGGFNTMGIPHGRCRKTIVSRYDGLVCSLDFNAIDYRCIVASIPEIQDMYADCDDFHSRTQKICDLMHLTRDQVKYAAYVYIYGGSEKTCSERTGLSIEQTRDVMSKMDDTLRPIMRFRERLHQKAMQDGYVTTPSGRRINVETGDHPGKVIGLYAQSYSSEVFGESLLLVDRMIIEEKLKTKIIFPVHDEMVLDVPLCEDVFIDRFLSVVENRFDRRFKIKAKKGRSYFEATEP